MPGPSVQAWLDEEWSKDQAADEAALIAALAADAAADAAATAALNAQITKLKADLAACQAGTPTGDTTAPSAPTGVGATVLSSTQISVTWAASTDAVGVTGYRIFRGGVEVGTRVGTSFSDSGLTAGTSYTYTVKAYDAAGNMSAASATVTATTSGVVTPPTGGFVWAGKDTVQLTKAWMLANTGPKIPRVSAPSGNVSGTISGKKFTGTVVPANGTIFNDCEFTGGGYAIDGDGRKFTVNRCLFKGNGGPAAILGNVTAVACNISGWEDGIKFQGSGWSLKSSYLFGPSVTSTSHNDGVAAQWDNSNGTIAENRIEWTDTSEVFCQKLSGQISNITVTHNWLGGSDLPVRIEDGITGSKVIENAIKKGHWGYWELNSSVSHSGNVDADSGASID